MIKAKLVASAVALLCCSTAAPAQAQWATTCTREFNSSVNLRNAPSKNARVLASIPNESTIRTMDWVWGGGDGLRWYRVEYGGLVGWMRSDYMCR